MKGATDKDIDSIIEKLVSVKGFEYIYLYY